MSDSNLTLDAAGAAPALPAASPAPAASFAGGMGDLRGRATGFLRQPAVARALPMIGLLAVVALAALAWMALRQPPQRDLFRGLGDADKAAVAGQLDKSGIKYSFDDSSGAITVSEEDYFQAKMDVASAGLPKSAPDGDSVLDNLPMGASRAVEGEKLRSAREVDLARTIEAIDAVQSARVHLAVEPPSIFLRDQAKPSASVMLRLASGRALSAAQVQAIVHLVASSVSELSPDQVSVVDQNGRLLSNDGGDTQTDRQVALQAQVEDRYRQSVVALLTPVLGEGNFSAEVHAELNFNERQATREVYPADEARLASEQVSWSTDGKSQEASGIPGALAAAPPPAGTPQTQAQANAEAAAAAAPGVPGEPADPLMKTQQTANRRFELGREVSVTKEATGTVKRLSVAVALAEGAKPRSQAELTAIEKLIKGAVGFDQARGDVVALSARKFAAADDAADAPAWYEASWVPMLARNLSALAVALVLLLGVGRPLLKRRAAAAAATTEVSAEMRQRVGREINQELGRAAVADPGATVTLDMISSTHGYADRAQLIRNFVKQDPDRAALVVRDLLREGKKPENA